MKTRQARPQVPASAAFAFSAAAAQATPGGFLILHPGGPCRSSPEGASRANAAADGQGVGHHLQGLRLPLKPHSYALLRAPSDSRSLGFSRLQSCFMFYCLDFPLAALPGSLTEFMAPKEPP